MILAISTLSFELGIATREWPAITPFRMRVNISAIGSIIVIVHLHPLTTKTSQRQGSCPAAPVHGNKYGTDQSGGYSRVGVHNERSDSVPGCHASVVPRDIA